MGRANSELVPGPALEAALRRGVAPLVALVGEEDFLKEDALRMIRDAMGPDVEVETVDGPRNEKEAAVFDPAGVFDGLRTGSLFGGSRVVAVRRADRFVSDAAEPLGRLFEQPVRGAVLVLFLTKIDGRTRVGKALRAKGLTVTCRRLYDRPAPWLTGKVPAHDTELSRWAQARAQKAGKRMSLEVAHALTEHTGNDLGRLAGSIDTLALFVGERPEIDGSALDDLVGGTGEQTVFHLCDEILDRDGPTALRTLETAYQSGLDMGAKAVRDPQSITLIVIGQLFKKFRELYRARRALDERVPVAQALERFGPKQKAFRSVFERHLRGFDTDTLRRAMAGLREMDLAIKTGGAAAGPALVLETFVVALCRRRAVPVPRPAARAPGRGNRWG